MVLAEDQRLVLVPTASAWTLILTGSDPYSLEAPVKQIWEDKKPARPAAWRPPVKPPTTNKRAAERRSIVVPARLAWKDHRGISRFASVVTRDVSDYGVFIECGPSLSIPL